MSARLCLTWMAAALAAAPLLTGRAAADPVQRISGPIVHENVAVYFVHGPSAPGSVPLTLQEALTKSAVEVTETGNVRELKIENKGTEPVFVQFGDIVKGGKQDRVLTVSLLLPANSGPVPIGAYCVEQGRWAARGKENVHTFALSEALMPSRDAKVAIARAGLAQEGSAPAGDDSAAASVRPPVEPLPPAVNAAPRGAQQQLRTTPLRSQDGQSEVWRSVSNVQGLLSANLGGDVASEKSRSSLQLALENEQVKRAQDAIVAAIEPAGLEPADVVGVVVAVNGRLSSADVYPSNGLFRKMWPKLARAGATEALAGKQAPAEAAPAIDAVQAFLTDAESGKKSERQLGSFARVETRDASKAVRLEARSPAGTLVHRNYIAK